MRSQPALRVSAGRVIRLLVASAILGGAISFVMSGARIEPQTGRSIAGGAIIGVCIAAFAMILEALVRNSLATVSEATGRFVRAFLFLIAGAGGYYVGMMIAQVMVWGRARPDLSIGIRMDALLIAGGLAVGIGVVFYTYETLRSRLELSVQRLKDREFADKELELARSIQQRLLPPSSIESAGYRVESRNVAAQYVAGDFYDVFHQADGTLGLVVADVAGKGIGASLIMATVKAVLPLIAAGKSVEETLAELNVRIHRDLARREFVALSYAHYDPRTSTLRVGNAGLPDPLLIRRGQAPEPLPVPGPRLPLGLRVNLRYEALTLKLSPGDRVLLYSDGLPEAPMENGEPLGYEALVGMAAGDEPDPAIWLDRLLDALRAETRETIEDDWTALLLEASWEGRSIPSLESVAPGIPRLIPGAGRRPPVGS